MATDAIRPSAPPPRDAHEREQKNALSAFTRSLVTSMNRTTYYEPGHPKYFTLRDELFGELRQVMGDQSQVGYMLQRGRTDEIWVDGLAAGRCRLSETMVASSYEVVAPRFVDYFERYQLVLLAFRRGVTRDEFGTFVGLMTRPLRQGHDEELSAELLRAGVRNISSLSRTELDPVDATLPWQVRVCIARLTRDLQTIPLYAGRPLEEVTRAKEQIFADIVRPLLQASDVRELVIQAPRIERAMDALPELAGLRIVDMIVRVLSPARLVALTELLLADFVEASRTREAVVPPLREALERATERLVVERVPEADPVLRKLYDAKVVRLDQLPPELQEWIAAEALFEQRSRGARASLPLATARDLRVAAKLARLGVIRERLDETVAVLDAFRAILVGADAARAGEASAALDQVLPERDLDALVERFDAAPGLADERRLLRALGRVAAPALVRRVIAGAREGRRGPAYELLDAMPEEALDVVAQVLGRTAVHPAAAGSLLGLGARRAHPAMFDVAVRFLRHPDATLRLAALRIVLANRSEQERPILERAMEDASAEIVALARKELLDRHRAVDAVVALSVRILTAATPQTAPEILVVALDQLARTPPTSATRSGRLPRGRALRSAALRRATGPRGGGSAEARPGRATCRYRRSAPAAAESVAPVSASAAPGCWGFPRSDDRLRR